MRVLLRIYGFMDGWVLQAGSAIVLDALCGGSGANFGRIFKAGANLPLLRDGRRQNSERVGELSRKPAEWIRPEGG